MQTLRDWVELRERTKGKAERDLVAWAAADWLEEQGLGAEAEAVRVLVAKGLKANKGLKGGEPEQETYSHDWWAQTEAWDERDGIPNTAVIPFKMIKRCTGVYAYIYPCGTRQWVEYETPADAILGFVEAYAACIRAGEPITWRQFTEAKT